MKKAIKVMATGALVASLVAPVSAFAATTNSAVTVPTVQQGTADTALGSILFTEVSAGSVKAGDVVTIKLPEDLVPVGGAVTAGGVTTGVAATDAAMQFVISAPQGVNESNPLVAQQVAGPPAVTLSDLIDVTPSGTDTINIKFKAAYTQDVANKVKLLVAVNHAKIDADASGNLDATISAPAGTGFTGGTVTVATAGQGSTTFTEEGKKVISQSGTEVLKDLYIDEAVVGTFQPYTATATPDSDANYVKIALPSGFSWNTTGAGFAATGEWGFGNVPLTTTVATDSNGKSALYINIPAATTTQVGRIHITGAQLNVDESVARFGDVTSTISGKGTNKNVTKANLAIADYEDYGIKVEGYGDATNLIAGKKDQDIAGLHIKEALSGSLVPGRTITLTLPEGAKWYGYNAVTGAIPTDPFNHKLIGGNDYTYAGAVGTDGRTIKYTVSATASASEVDLTDAQVEVAPDFAGDLKVTVGGNAGATGEVTVAKATAPVAITSANQANIQIGVQGQTLGDITVKENAAESLKALVGSNNLVLRLPSGSSWDNIPTVTVTEGDLVLNTESITKSGRYLTIPVKTSSTTPSTITVSGAKVTLDRTVPEGDFKVAISSDATGPSTAVVDPTVLALFPQNTTVVSSLAATVVTPANGVNATPVVFTVGSTDYTVNGAKQTLDVAPFIDGNGRTLVPVRALSEGLGATVGWDQDTQTVSVVKDGKAVSLQVGSAKLNVGGVPVIMDTQAVNKDSRVFVPFRAIAEALGATVSYDASAGTVTVK